MNRIIAIFAVFIALTGCEKEKMDCPGETEKTFDHIGFNAVKAGETFGLSIIKGDHYSVKAQGCATDLGDLDISVDGGGALNIQYKRFRHGRYRVKFDIVTPNFHRLILEGAANANVAGFDNEQGTLTAILSGTAEATVTGATQNTAVELHGTSKLNVTGVTATLKGNVYEASRLFSFEAAADEVDVNTNGTAQARVHPVSKLYALATSASKILYKGHPAVTDLRTEGAGKIERSPE